MPRRRCYDQISEYHLGRIDRQIGLLKTALSEASLSLTPFRPHYDAISDLNGDLVRAVNLLNGRPADFQVAHQSFLQGRLAADEKSGDHGTADRTEDDSAERPR